MRLAVVSDTHLGEEACTLVTAGANGVPHIGPGFGALRRALGRVDYLVLLGDIMDFSVASYEVAYRHARVFFRQLRREGLAREVIYVPGNHDFDIWHTVEHQVNVINQLLQGQLPRAFRRSVPGVIDDRAGSPRRGFRLPDVAARPEWHADRRPYGDLFLDHIAQDGRGGGRLPFSFAYPNLYLVADTGESVLLTHGHYFEAWWSISADWVQSVAGDDLAVSRAGELSLQEMVGINLPLNQLACTGIGQAEPLTGVARAVQREAVLGRTDRLARYLERGEALVLRALHAPAGLRGLQRWALRWLGRKLLAAVATAEHTRYSETFLESPDVRQRFRRYYRHSVTEQRRLREEHGLELPPPTHVIFGHTHQPIPWGSPELCDVVDGRSIRFCNTGGWLLRDEPDGSRSFPGASVVLYETGRGFRSVAVGAADLSQREPAAAAASVA